MRNSNLSSSSVNNVQSDTSFNGDPENYDDDQDHVQGEESGWTSYFDDFFSNKTTNPSSSQHIDNMAYDNEEEEKEEEDGNSFYGGSGSAVSDAASCAAWRSTSKSLHRNYDERSSSSSRRRADALAACSSFDGTQMVIHKKLRFKKSIMYKISGDYYDDSLEDTASSPVNSPKAKGEIYGSYDHQQSQEINGLKQQVVEVNKSLKEKGLCLVPYSMLLNYIG